MKLNSQTEKIFEIKPEWYKSIPENSNLTFSIISDVIDDETYLYHEVEHFDSFIYYQPSEDGIKKLLSEFAIPFTGVLDAKHRDDHDITDDWLLQHHLTFRRGGGNINISLQKEALRIFESYGRTVYPKNVHRGFTHRDHNETEFDWSFYQMAHGEPGRILSGPLWSIFDEIEGAWNIRPKLSQLNNILSESFDTDKAVDVISRWSFTALRAARTALYHAFELSSKVSHEVLEEDVLYEMDSQTVHWMPKHKLTQERTFFRDIVTRQYSKIEKPTKYDKFMKELVSPDEKIQLLDSRIGM